MAKDEAIVMGLGGGRERGEQVSGNMLVRVCRTCPGYGFAEGGTFGKRLSPLEKCGERHEASKDFLTKWMPSFSVEKGLQSTEFALIWTLSDRGEDTGRDPARFIASKLSSAGTNLSLPAHVSILKQSGERSYCKL